MWRWGRILFLIFGVLCLGVYYLYVDFEGKEKTAEKIDSKRILTLSEGQTVVGLELTNREGEILELSRENGRWWLVKPIRYPADDLIADGLIAALTTTTWSRSFSVESVNLKEAGLRDPVQRVGVVLNSEGAPKRYLFIGEESKAGRMNYVMWGDGTEVFLVHDQFAKALDKNLFSLRKKRIFDFFKEDLHSIQLVLDNKDLTLVKQGGQWFRVWREASVQNRNQVEGLWQQCEGFYVKAFLDQLNPENPDLGLHSPKSFISITDTKGETTTLWLGAENKENEGFYALKDGEKAVLLIPESARKQVSEAVASFGALPLALSEAEESQSPEAGEKDVTAALGAEENPDHREEIEPEERDVVLEPAEEIAPAETSPAQTAVEIPEIGRAETEEDLAIPLEAVQIPSSGEGEKPVPAETVQPKPEKPDLEKEPASRKPSVVTGQNWLAEAQGIQMKKLGTEVRLAKGNGWSFDGSTASNAEKLNQTVSDFLNYFDGIKLTERVDESKKPRVPYAITIRFLQPDGTERKYVFYKARGEILAEASVQEGLYRVPAEIWDNLERYFGEILTCRNFGA